MNNIFMFAQVFMLCRVFTAFNVWAYVTDCSYCNKITVA